MAATLVFLLLVAVSHTMLCDPNPELLTSGGEHTYAKHRGRPRRGLLGGLVGSLLTIPGAPSCSDAHGDSFSLGATLPLGISAGLSSSSADASSKQGCSGSVGSVSGSSHGHTSIQASSGSPAAGLNSQYDFGTGGGFQSGSSAGHERGSESDAVRHEAGSPSVGSGSSSIAASASKGGGYLEGSGNTLGGVATGFKGHNGVDGGSVTNNVGTGLQEVHQGGSKHVRLPHTEGVAFTNAFSESKASSSSGSSSKGNHNNAYSSSNSSSSSGSSSKENHNNAYSSSNSNASSSSHSNSARIFK